MGDELRNGIFVFRTGYFMGGGNKLLLGVFPCCLKFGDTSTIILSPTTTQRSLAL